MSWRSSLLLVVALLYIFASAQSQEIYTISEGDIVRIICPLVVPAPLTDFKLQPSSTNGDFLLGTYSITPPVVNGFTFSRQNGTCGTTGTGSSIMCNELAVVFSSSFTGRDSFDVGYKVGMQTRTFRINYATSGLYIVHPNGDGVLRPLSDRSALDGYLLVYGQNPSDFVFCDRNGNQTDTFVVKINNTANECSRATNMEIAVRFDIRIEHDNMEDHELYIASETCSSDTRSEYFSASLSAVEVPTTTEPTPGDVTTPPVTTDDVGGTGSPSNGYVTVIVAVMGSFLGVVLIAIIVVVAIVVVVVKWGVCFAHRGKGQEHVENGPSSPHLSPNTRLLLEGSNESGGDTPITKNNVHPKVPENQIEYIAFSGSDQDNWFQSMMSELKVCHHTKNSTIVDRLDSVRDRLIKRDCLLYILQYGSQEITSPVDKAPPSVAVMSELETLGLTEESKNNIFVVRFGAEENDHILQSRYHILLRKDDPSEPRFSFSKCAKLIHRNVSEIRGEGNTDESDGQVNGVFPKEVQDAIIEAVHAEGVKSRKAIKELGESNIDMVESEGRKIRELTKLQTAKIIETVERGNKELREDIGEVGESVDNANAKKDQADVEPAVQDP